MRKISFTLLFFMLAFSLMAQESLSLQEAVSAMRENNVQIKLQLHELEISKAELAETKSGFLPQISLSHSGFRTNDPLNTFGFKLQQKIVTQYDFNPYLLNNPDAMTHFNTKIAAQQPLLNFDVFASRKALKNKMEAVGYQAEFAADMLEVEVKNSYTNLQFLYEAKSAVAKGVEAYQEVLRNTKNLQEQGYAKLSDVLMVEVGLNEVKVQLLDVENNIENLSDYLSWLMGRTQGTVYKPNEPLLNPLIEYIPDSNFSENRNDIKAMDKGIEAYEKVTSIYKNALLPRINAFGEINYNDKDILGLGGNNYFAGVSLSWDVFDGNKTFNQIKRAKLDADKSKIEREKYIDQKQLELNKAIRDLAKVEQRIGLEETAKEQAAESLRIIENRYEQGLEKTADVLVARSLELQKQVSFLEAMKDRKLAIIQIDFLTNN